MVDAIPIVIVPLRDQFARCAVSQRHQHRSQRQRLVEVVDRHSVTQDFASKASIAVGPCWPVHTNQHLMRPDALASDRAQRVLKVHWTVRREQHADRPARRAVANNAARRPPDHNGVELAITIVGQGRFIPRCDQSKRVGIRRRPMFDEDGAGQPKFEHRRRIGTSVLEAHSACAVHASDHPRRSAFTARTTGQVGEIDHHTVVLRVEADSVKDAPISQLGGWCVPIGLPPAARQPTQQIATARPPTSSSTDQPASPNADRQDLSPDLQPVASNRAR